MHKLSKKSQKNDPLQFNFLFLHFFQVTLADHNWQRLLGLEPSFNTGIKQLDSTGHSIASSRSSSSSSSSSSSGSYSSDSSGSFTSTSSPSSSSVQSYSTLGSDSEGASASEESEDSEIENPEPYADPQGSQTSNITTQVGEISNVQPETSHTVEKVEDRTEQEKEEESGLCPGSATGQREGQRERETQSAVQEETVSFSEDQTESPESGSLLHGGIETEQAGRESARFPLDQTLCEEARHTEHPKENPPGVVPTEKEEIVGKQHSRKRASEPEQETADWTILVDETIGTVEEANKKKQKVSAAGRVRKRNSRTGVTVPKSLATSLAKNLKKLSEALDYDG